jgi:hypothetical protein
MSGTRETLLVELSADGDLRLSAELAHRYFPEDALVAQRRERELWLLPLIGPEAGGLLLKQRNAAGDRSTIVREALGDRLGGSVAGQRSAFWDPAAGALRVDVSPVEHGGLDRDGSAR